MADYQVDPSSRKGSPTDANDGDKNMATKTVPAVQRTQSITRVSRAVPPTEEFLILVMGQSGVGKTSFINTISNSTVRMSSAPASDGEKLELSLPFYVDGKCIRLIDTPAFGDAAKSDTDVLTAIASYLATEYTNGRKLSGAIYLHSIAVTRLRGPGRRNLSLFTKLCGKQALANVAIVTTRWDQVDFESGEARERELRTKTTLLKPLLEVGATLFRYHRSQDAIFSAQSIIRHFLPRIGIPLLIQQEMVDDGQLIPETTAGRALQKEYRAQLDEYQKNMQDLRVEYDELKKDNRPAIAKKVKNEMIVIKESAEKLKEESKKLSVTKTTVLPSQPLRVMVSPTVLAAPNVASTSQHHRRSSVSPFRHQSIPPLPQNPPSALRTPRPFDKGKGRQVPQDVIQPVPVRTRRRSLRQRDEPERRHRSRKRRSSDGETVLVLEGWEDFRYAIVGVVFFLILIPFIRRSQALASY